MRSKTYLIIILVSGLLLIGLGVVSRTYLLALYHQRQGGHLLDQVMHEESGDRDQIYACELDPIISSDYQERIKGSISHLEAALYYKPDLTYTYLSLGRAFCLSGNITQAIHYLTGYIEQKPKNPLGFIELAMATERQKDEAGGKSSSSVPDLYPDMDFSHIGESQEDLISAWQDAGLTVQDFIDVGEQMLAEKQYDKALTWSLRALILSPDSLQPWFLIGEVYQQQNRFDEAIGNYTYLSQIYPNNRQIWYELGSVYELKSDWISALDTYQRGLMAEAGRVGLSNLYYRIGYLLQLKVTPSDEDAAWEAYQTALELDDYPIDTWQIASTYYQKGLILSGKGKWKQAIQEYDQAIMIRSNYYLAYIELAKSYLAIGDEEKAIADLFNAIEIDPERKDAYLILGDLYLSNGNKTKSLEMYRKVLELDPSDTLALKGVDNINNPSTSP